MKSKVQILHIIKSLGRGGAETLLPETLKLHDKSKFDFHYLYFLPWKHQLVDDLIVSGGKVICFPANNNIQLIFQIRKVLRYVKQNNISIIHAHLPWAGIVARMAGRFMKVPIIYTEHNKQERYHVATRIMNIATMNWATRIVAVSDDVAKSIIKHKSKLKAPVHIILNGVNTKHFSPGMISGSAIRSSLSIPEQASVIGTVAVFRFQKRLDVWMEIAKKILIDKPDTQFIIVGDGPLKARLLAKRGQLELEDKIHFVGLQTEVRPYLAAFDLYMMSSSFEGLPIALLEAMALGCAVISTNAGGIKEVIQHGSEGMLCSVDNPELLAPLAIELLSSQEKRKQLALSGRRRIEEFFSLDKMVSHLENLYHDVIKKH